MSNSYEKPIFPSLKLDLLPLDIATELTVLL